MTDALAIMIALSPTLALLVLAALVEHRTTEERYREHERVIRELRRRIRASRELDPHEQARELAAIREELARVSLRRSPR